MRNWGENEELPKIEGISPEDQTTMNRVLDEAEGIKWSIKEHNEAQRELVQIMRLQKDLSKKLQSKNSKNLAEEIMKYAFPANELCRKFEKILDLEKAREFFIDLGVLRNKIIDTRAPELQNVQPLAAPLMNHFMEEEEHKD
jgi:hypothetical protein